MKKIALLMVLLISVALPTGALAYVYPPRISNPPQTQSTLADGTVVLRKDLNAYSGYGAGGTGADILYWDNPAGSWSFDTSGLPGYSPVKFVISGVLDDHHGRSTSLYTADVTVGSATVFSGSVPYKHGTPFGGPFGNWTSQDVPANGQSTITIRNSSTGTGGGDWMAFNWIELHLKDITPPDITFSGSQTYTVDQTVAITCVATDTGSGIASTTCPSVATGPAYDFLGSNTVTASATDKAGNSTTRSFTFTVNATYDGLAALTTRFVAPKPNLGKSLQAKLEAARAVHDRGNAQAESGVLDAFLKEIAAQTGKALTADQVATLKSVVAALR